MKKLLLATTLLALTGGAAAAETIRLGTEGAYPPFNFIDDQGNVAGFERELGDELCKRAGLTCEWVTNDWDSIIPNLQSGNYDVIIAGMSITDEREKVVDFSENYVPPADSAYVGLTADADVKGGVVSAQVGTIQAGYVAESGATLLEFPTPDETVAAVRNGEAVAVFADKDFLAPYVAESNGELTYVGDAIALGGGVGLAFRDSDDELREKFNAAIRAMKAEGALNPLIEKHFGPEAKKF
ncbi:amino acid ABC transporter [Gemmobacter lanyuensis]|uniref:Amino acid ABC transporter n=1 Tax=Gemmobacter lanyuensis TaxID=1054497 RepID=A0A918IWY6_9RHOB|nr:transporter substrate-binding domain-containing protein [Gemmobacter lanyuensis]GGW36734.1 amino acid ABC transporter [Gemmobacter lanyuensis]